MKLDKYDRMFIAFIFVVVTIVSICNCCFADEGSEEVYFSSVEGVFISGTDHTLKTSSTATLYYIELDENYIYHISITASAGYRLGFSNSIDLGTQVYNYQASGSGKDIEMTVDASTMNYLFFDISSDVPFTTYTITKTLKTGFSTSVDSLVQNVGVNQLWGVFENGIDFVGVVVLCAFGFFLVFLLIKKLTKGKSDF